MCGRNCAPTTQIVVGLPLGHPLATHGGSKHVPHNKMVIYVEDTSEAANLIREAQAVAAGTMNAAAAMPTAQMAMPVAAPAVPVEMTRETPVETLKNLKEMLDIGA